MTDFDKEKANDRRVHLAYQWVQIIMDFTELNILSSTGIYLLYKRWKIGRSTLSRVIWLQIALLVT